MANCRKRGGCLKILLLILVGLAVFLAWDLKGNQKKDTDPVSHVENTIDENSLTQKYYYEQLGETKQVIYQILLQGISDGLEEIRVPTGQAEQVKQVYEYLIFDHPELFWCNGSASITSYAGFMQNDAYSLLEPYYAYDEAKRQSMQAEIDTAVAECLSGVSKEMSDYEKIRYVFEYIIKTTVYNRNAEDNQNIYSVFVNKESVCAGYAKATQYLLEKLGIFSTYVAGSARGGESHAWNLVQCSGNYYYVDTTWGDPVFSGEIPEIELEEESIDYDYLCCTEEELLRTHEISDTVPMPPCTSDDYNYYKLNGMYYETYDSDMALKAMNHSILNQEIKTVFKYADADTYQTAGQDIKSRVLEQAAQNLAQWYGLEYVQYYYQFDPETYKVVIYWQYD